MKNINSTLPIWYRVIYCEIISLHNIYNSYDTHWLSSLADHAPGCPWASPCQLTWGCHRRPRPTWRPAQRLRRSGDFILRWIKTGYCRYLKHVFKKENNFVVKCQNSQNDNNHFALDFKKTSPKQPKHSVFPIWQDLLIDDCLSLSSLQQLPSLCERLEKPSAFPRREVLGEAFELLFDLNRLAPEMTAKAGKCILTRYSTDCTLSKLPSQDIQD